MEVNLGSRSLVLDPALIVGVNVTPSRLKLVAHGPHEVALNIVVENVHSALSKAHDLVISVVG